MSHRRARFAGAFRGRGSGSIAAVVSYDSLFVRDHWAELTDVAWCYRDSGIIEHEIAWISDYLIRSGLDWIQVRPCLSRAERSERDFSPGEQPSRSGVQTSVARSIQPQHHAPTTDREVDDLIPVHDPVDLSAWIADGRADVSTEIGRRFDVVRYGSIGAPVWSLYSLFGYEGMMTFIADRPDLAEYAASRITENAIRRTPILSALGADAVWIEDCLTDQIAPRVFGSLNVPLIKRLVSVVASLGMKSIYYYCGNPFDRFDEILEIGPDAVHFEESKKSFTIDIEAVARRLDGRAVLFGNLDSIGILQQADVTGLRNEILRQLRACELNRGKFVMSTGSPVTPETGVERVKLYADLVHELCT